MARLVLAGRRSARTDDYLADTRFSHNPTVDDWARAEETRAMIGAPILDREAKVIAILWAYNRSWVTFADKDETVIVGLAQQAALAIGTARGVEGERQGARQTASLLEIAQVCASTLELRPLLRAVARQVAQALGAERCTINLFQAQRLMPVMAQFADGHVDSEMWAKFKKLGQTGVQTIPADSEAARTRRPVVIDDVSMSALVTPEWVEAFGLRSILVVPLISGDRVIGTLSLDETRAPRVRGSADQDLAMTMAAQVALGVDRARQYEESAQRAAEVQTLSAIGETLASTLDLQEVLDAIADSATKLTGAPAGGGLRDGRGGRAPPRSGHARNARREGSTWCRWGRGRRVPRWPVARRYGAPTWSQDPLPGYDSLQVQENVSLAEMATALRLPRASSPSPWSAAKRPWARWASTGTRCTAPTSARSDS